MESRLWRIEDVRQIITDQQYGPVGDQMCDLTTAKAVVTVYEALRGDHQQRAQREVPFARFARFAWKQVWATDSPGASSE